MKRQRPGMRKQPAKRPEKKVQRISGWRVAVTAGAIGAFALFSAMPPPKQANPDEGRRAGVIRNHLADPVPPEMRSLAFTPNGFYNEKDLGAIAREMEQVIELRDQSGNPLFADMWFLQRYTLARKNLPDSPVAYARRLAAEGFDAKSIYRFRQIGLSIDEVLHFKDTAKPNAVLIYPEADDYGTFERDHNGIERMDEQHQLMRRVRGTYDVFLRVAADERTVYDALDTIPDIKLFILAGHGQPDRIQLGNGRSEYNSIGMEDAEFERHLKNLPDDAVILLLSCSTAQGVDGIAHRIAEYARPRKVIASKEIFRLENLFITSDYPFDAEFRRPFWTAYDPTESRMARSNMYYPSHGDLSDRDVTYKSK